MKKIFYCFFLFIFIVPSKGEAKQCSKNHAKIILNSSYKKCIFVVRFYVNRKQLESLLNKKRPNSIQLPNNQLDPHELYLLVKIKNRGVRTAFGELELQIPNQDQPIIINTSILPIRMWDYYDYIIPIENNFEPNKDYPPRPQIKWNYLYTTHKDYL